MNTDKIRSYLRYRSDAIRIDKALLAITSFNNQVKKLGNSCLTTQFQVDEMIDYCVRFQVRLKNKSDSFEGSDKYYDFPINNLFDCHKFSELLIKDLTVEAKKYPPVFHSLLTLYEVFILTIIFAVILAFKF